MGGWEGVGGWVVGFPLGLACLGSFLGKGRGVGGWEEEEGGEEGVWVGKG